MHKVMIVDNTPKHRLQIAAIVQQIPGVEIIANLENGVQVLHWCYNNKVMPDTILLEVALPKLDGVGTMEFLSDFFAKIKVLVISSHSEKQVIKDMLAAGALGFLWKYNDYPNLKAALQLVLNNEVYIDERLNDDAYSRDALMLERTAEKEKIRTHYKLTNRDWQMLKIIASQTNYKEIGTIFNITPKTVETYVARLNKKLAICGGKFSLLTFCISSGISKFAKL